MLALKRRLLEVAGAASRRLAICNRSRKANSMDMKVKPLGNGRWILIDLLGREIGDVLEVDERFKINPNGHGVEALRGAALGPFQCLDDALAEIERHTRGLCRLELAETKGTTASEKLNADNDE
jgi:hypothetical protein